VKQLICTEADSFVGLPCVDCEVSDGFGYAQEERTRDEIDGTAADQGVSGHPDVPIAVVAGTL